MRSTTGKSVLNGIAVGPLRVIRRSEAAFSALPEGDAAAELIRFEAARQRAIEEQHKLYEKTLQEAGSQLADLFQTHAMLLKDAGLIDSVHNLILKEHYSAEYAVLTTGRKHAEMLAGLNDDYISARSADIEDVTQALLDELTGERSQPALGDKPVIVLADDLTPSETVRMDKKLLLGFVTLGGSAFSHTAILARSMNIPALV